MTIKEQGLNQDNVEVKVRCFKLTSGQSLIASVTPIEVEGQLVGYNATKVRILALASSPSNPEAFSVRLWPYLLGVHEPLKSDLDSIPLMKSIYHVDYIPSVDLEEYYLQDSDSMIVQSNKEDRADD